MTPKDDKKIPGPATSIKIVFGTPVPKELEISEGVQVSFRSSGPGTGKTDDLLFTALREARNHKAVHESQTKRISKPPGFWIRSLADIFCSGTTMKRVVEPSIADMQSEYFEALQSNQKLKAF